MAKKPGLSPAYIVFVALMLLLVVIGVCLMVYGSAHNGVPLPSVPGDALFARGSHV